MEVKRNRVIGENGLYSTKLYQKDEIVHVLDGKITAFPTKYSIHIGNNVHVTDEYGIYMNHSFDPTTRIEGRNVIAVKNIEKGEELTFNYNESEASMASPFTVEGILVGGKKT